MKKSKSGRKVRKRNPEKTKRNKEIKEWRRKALERAFNRCEWCGAPGPGLNVHHIISRKYKPLLIDDCNNIVLCPKCHKFSIGRAAHENPVKVALWLMENYPLKWEYLVEVTKTM